MTATPTIEAVKALDGRIFEMLDDSELQTLEFYRAQGRKFGVSIQIENKADPIAVAAATSRQEADHIMKSFDQALFGPSQRNLRGLQKIACINRWRLI